MPDRLYITRYVECVAQGEEGALGVLDKTARQPRRVPTRTRLPAEVPGVLNLLERLSALTPILLE
jgi:hypothetical protein